MSGAASDHETEIKLRIASPEEGKRLLTRCGFRVTSRRSLESDLILDYADGRLRQAGTLLRLRRRGRAAILTWKGRAQPGRHKSREELEVAVDDPDLLESILGRLDLRPAFRYQKYRTVHSAPRGGGLATIDETPIGAFLELEGEPRWIDRTARRLGFSEAAYVTASYAGLYREFREQHPEAPADMLFR
jgi:adenylate cyclase class 2